LASIFVILTEANVDSLRLVATHLASVERIELPQADLEAAVLPLYYTEFFFIVYISMTVTAYRYAL
jgi:hypothetical protein